MQYEPAGQRQPRPGTCLSPLCRFGRKHRHSLLGGSAHGRCGPTQHSDLDRPNTAIWTHQRSTSNPTATTLRLTTETKSNYGLCPATSPGWPGIGCVSWCHTCNWPSQPQLASKPCGSEHAHGRDNQTGARAGMAGLQYFHPSV